MLRTLKSKRLLWGLFLFSLGLHGAILILPWPDRTLSSSQLAFEDTPPKAAVSGKPLDSAQLPAISIATLPNTTDSPSSEDSTEPAELSPSVIPAAQLAPVVAAPVIPNQIQAVQPVQPQDSSQNPPQNAQSEPTPEVQPEVEPSQSQPQSDIEEAVAEEVLASAASDLSPDTSPEHGMVVQLGDDFPDLADAESGCYGLENCRQVSGNFRQAAQQLVSQMEGNGYELTEREDLDNTGHRVYEVVDLDDPDATYYLNVFSPDIGSAVYVLTVDILSLEALKQLSS